MTIKKKAHLTGHNAGVFALTYGAQEGHFFSGAGDGFMVDWNIQQPDLGHLMAQVPSSIFALCYIPDKKCLVAGNRDGGLHFIDTETRQNIGNIAHHKKGVFDIHYLAEQVVTLGGDGLLTCWSLSPLRRVESVHLSAKSLRHLAVSPCGTEWIVAASDGFLYGLDAVSWAVKWQQKAHDPAAFAVAYVADGRYVVSGGRDAQLKLWRRVPKGLENCQTLPAHWYTINTIAVHPIQNTIFATGSRDKTIKIWSILPSKTDPTEGEVVLLKVLDTIRDGCHVNSVNRLLWLPDGQTLVSASDDRSIALWDTAALNDF